ncbi:MAG: hypothetical protein BIFFINMI_01891 [Phycisphaerae bacterium]|nr:hypothetical protein [Phycisphaerae bacterium]
MPSKPRDFMGPRREGYFPATHRPLNCLFFLLPLIVWIELGSLWVDWGAAASTQERVRAFWWILQFFRIFRSVPACVPGVVLVLVFLIWHRVQHDRLRWGVVGGMFVESVLLCLPLLMMNHLFNFYAMKATTGAAGSPGIGQELIIALTAGVYEELIFRLLLIWLLGMLVVDLFEWRKGPAMSIVVVASGLMFAGYHFLGSSAVFDSRKFLFLSLSGIYLGALYLQRGFGIAVGVHALYDVVLVCMS